MTARPDADSEIVSEDDDNTIQYNNKKLRYREEHSASVVLSWCTL